MIDERRFVGDLAPNDAANKDGVREKVDRPLHSALGDYGVRQQGTSGGSERVLNAEKRVFDLRGK